MENTDKNSEIETAVTDSFISEFERYQDGYSEFLMWCMSNNGVMSMKEWNTKKAIEFKRRGLDTFFKVEAQEETQTISSLMPDIMPSLLSLDFKSTRKAKGLTLREVERLTGLSNAYLSQLETGKIRQPSYTTVVTLISLYSDVIGLNNPWSLRDVLANLIGAAEVLLHQKNYDGHGWEEINHCVERGKEIVSILSGKHV